MTTRAGALLSIVSLTSAATAQLPSFVYHIDAPTSMAPGQTATITVLCGFSPGVGGIVGSPVGPGPVWGLSAGAFDILGSGGAWTLGPPPNGSLIFPYNFIGTMHGTPSGGNVTGVLWSNGFGPPLGTVSTVNPTPLWTATFTAPASGPVTISVTPVGLHGVWCRGLGHGFTVESTSLKTTGAQVVIQVIPTPASLAVFGVGLLASARRRRGRS